MFPPVLPKQDGGAEKIAERREQRPPEERSPGDRIAHEIDIGEAVEASVAVLGALAGHKKNREQGEKVNQPCNRRWNQRGERRGEQQQKQNRCEREQGVADPVLKVYKADRQQDTKQYNHHRCVLRTKYRGESPDKDDRKGHDQKRAHQQSGAEKELFASALSRLNAGL